MVARLVILIVSLALAGSAMSAERSQPAEQRAAVLRESRDQLNAAPPASAELYERYFEAFPSSFAELREILVSDKYRDILLRPDEDWNFGLAYIVPMCESYETRATSISGSFSGIHVSSARKRRRASSCRSSMRSYRSSRMPSSGRSTTHYPGARTALRSCRWTGSSTASVPSISTAAN
jgi:hypothetical protein